MQPVHVPSANDRPVFQNWEQMTMSEYGVLVVINRTQSTCWLIHLNVFVFKLKRLFDYCNYDDDGFRIWLSPLLTDGCNLVYQLRVMKMMVDDYRTPGEWRLKGKNLTVLKNTLHTINISQKLLRLQDSTVRSQEYYILLQLKIITPRNRVLENPIWRRISR